MADYATLLRDHTRLTWVRWIASSSRAMCLGCSPLVRSPVSCSSDAFRSPLRRPWG